MAPQVTRIGSGLIAGACSAGLLALGTAAAPSHHLKKVRARLVATPATLVTATQLAPGDRVERLVELRVRGKGRVRGIYFQAAATKSSALDKDRQQGLQVTIERCTKKWRSRGLTTSCPGKSKLVLARRPLVGKTRLKLGRLTPKHPAHLRLGCARCAIQANEQVALFE